MVKYGWLASAIFSRTSFLQISLKLFSQVWYIELLKLSSFKLTAFWLKLRDLVLELTQINHDKPLQTYFIWYEAMNSGILNFTVNYTLQLCHLICFKQFNRYDGPIFMQNLDWPSNDITNGNIFLEPYSMHKSVQHVADTCKPSI